MGAVDLIENGKDVAVIDYHSGDAYENSASLSRLSYYGLTGTPTAWFDGGNAVIGGNHTTSMYPSYLPKYNLRKAVQSSFTIGLEGSNSGLIDYELQVTVEQVDPVTATNIRLHVVVTESNIMQSWQGMTELHHTERLMAPNQNGTLLDFSGGDIVEETISFTMNSSWVNENCEVVVFLQNAQTKEVYQATTAALSDFGTSSTNDAALLNVVVPQYVCQNEISPKVKIANYGLDNLTSLDIVYDVNGEPAMTVTWSGNLATYETEIVELDPYSFTLSDQNTFSINCENPNGEEDDFPSNNAKSIEMEPAMDVSSPVSLALKLDDNPDEITWEVLDSEGTVLYSGGPYSNAGQFIVEQFPIDESGCYAFRIYDAGGDGLTGTGSYKLAHEGSSIFAEGKDFGFEDEIQFGIGLTAVSEQVGKTAFDVYPNPVVGQATITFSLEKEVAVGLEIYNSLGEVVYMANKRVYGPGAHQMQIRQGSLRPGLYYVKMEIEDSSYTSKLIVQ